MLLRQLGQVGETAYYVETMRGVENYAGVRRLARPMRRGHATKNEPAGV